MIGDFKSPFITVSQLFSILTTSPIIARKNYLKNNQINGFSQLSGLDHTSPKLFISASLRNTLTRFK